MVFNTKIPQGMRMGRMRPGSWHWYLFLVTHCLFRSYALFRNRVLEPRKWFWLFVSLHAIVIRVSLCTLQISQLIEVVALCVTRYYCIPFRDEIPDDRHNILQLAIVCWAKCDTFLGGCYVIFVGRTPILSNVDAYTMIWYFALDVSAQIENVGATFAKRLVNGTGGTG
jgi:hypothetical protein